MLRQKQVVPLCNCVRAFIVGGTKNSTPDVSAAGFSEDDNLASDQNSKNCYPSYSAKPSPILPRSKVEAIPRTSKTVQNAVKVENSGPGGPVSHIYSSPEFQQGSNVNPTTRYKADKSQQVDFKSPASKKLAKQGLETVRNGLEFVQQAHVVNDLTSARNGLEFVQQAHVVNHGSWKVKTKLSSPSLEHDKSSFIKKSVATATEFSKISKSYLAKDQPKINQRDKDTEQQYAASPDVQFGEPAPRASSSQPSRSHPNWELCHGRDKLSERVPVKEVEANNYASVQKIGRCDRAYTGGTRPTRENFMMGGGKGGSNANIVDILRNVRKWGTAVEALLDNLGRRIDVYGANQILKQVSDCSVALGFFHWLKRQPGYKHDAHCYTTMIGILGRAQQFVGIDRMLDEMIRDGCEPNVVTYNRLINSYGKANYISKAMDIFHKMQEVGCEPDRVTYCTLIDIYAKAGHLHAAMNMYSKMLHAGIEPDSFTYGVIMNCLGSAGHVNDTYRLFCEMVERGCTPNVVTYNIMITQQAKAKNYSSALKIYRDMRNAGYHPDNVTYSIVMEVLGHCGYIDEAESLFMEMKRASLVPDEPVYGLLVDLWGKAGNVAKARAWFQAMLDAGLIPNVPICNSLLSAFLRVHLFDDAMRVLKSMLDLGLVPSLQTYTLLLSYCTTDTDAHKVLNSCVALMSVSGHHAHAFLLTMPEAGPDGQNVRDHADKFLDLMYMEDRESKRGLLDAVVDFLHKFGHKEEAGSIWDVAMQKNVYPNSLIEKKKAYWLINLHVMSSGTAVIALSRTLAWFRRQILSSDGRGPNRIDVVTGWGRRSKVTGSSLVRQSVYELLELFSSPFAAKNGNNGCFVGHGKPLNEWLQNSYIERMHLM